MQKAEGGIMRRPAGWISVGALTVIIGGGCGPKSERPSPLRTGAFAPQERTIPTDPMSPVDRSGPIESENPHVEPVVEPVRRRQTGAGAGGLDNGSSGRVSSVVSENTQSPIAAASTAPSPVVVTATAGPGSSGQYMTIGGVVAEVNNTPIYADKVIGQIAHVLAARAKDASPERFRQIAREEIGAQIKKLVDQELLYAAALRNLDEKDREVAALMTADWRRHKIAESQGSEELARKRAAEQGIGFDEMVNEQYRFFMTQLHLQKRLVPRIQVTANDMRRYYDTHVAGEFTVRDAARFRLIKISVKQVGDREEARKKIADLRRRIVEGGEDFAGIAGTTNDPMLARTKGELTVQRGAFAEAKAEEAVWATPIGEVTPVVETSDAFYIAKIEERTKGRIIPFEEEQTQEDIRRKLRAEQFRSLLEQAQADLRKDAIIRSTDEMARTAVEMAMQNYPAWSRKS